MALQSIININVDFYDKKYILLNAKQLDKGTRFLSVTCYNHGELYSINNSEHSAYIRYKKSDEHGVFNACEITRKGTILVGLTEQMLFASGVCCADLMIVNKGSAKIDSNTGEIIMIDNSGILSTMPFHIDVSETAIEHSEIESSYEYNGLNEALEKADAEYSQVIRLAKSYAMGGTNERVNENTDNAKYYYEQSKMHSTNAENFMNAASNSASSASKSAVDADISAQDAYSYVLLAEQHMNEASQSAIQAQNIADIVVDNKDKTLRYVQSAHGHMQSAEISSISAYDSASEAKNYFLQTEAITNSLNGAFLPKGTVTFAELVTLKESGVLAAGYLYNISDNFITDDNFRMGAGIQYEAGTNVYYTADEQFDCLAGTTVTGVKGVNESIYRKGNVELTAENVGAIPITNIATVNEIKTYLGII